VLAVVIVPALVMIAAVGFGFVTVGIGINAIAPDDASVVIVAPPRSIVLPDKYRLLNLCVGVPILYVTLPKGTILPVIKKLAETVLLKRLPVRGAYLS
jgi:hypothetical protein